MPVSLRLHRFMDIDLTKAKPQAVAMSQSDKAQQGPALTSSYLMDYYVLQAQALTKSVHSHALFLASKL